MIDYKDPKAVMRWLNGEDTEIEEDWLEGQIAELATACEYYVKVYLQERERAEKAEQEALKYKTALACGCCGGTGIESTINGVKTVCTDCADIRKDARNNA